MSVEDILNKIPINSYKDLSEGLINLLLKSQKVDNLPSEFGKDFLRLAMKDELASREGLKLLIQSLTMIEKEKVVEIFNNLGLGNVASILK
ncbi:MAG: hypothetical protein RMJ31_05935 [Nitrososphaerota archaeon]|nr:hypothetical protein [Nitrososphaerales archaeon]MCX8191276.1 hypothetical protein [Nitrososphaerales archaeon]MDW8045293.1 hypothetical protein [Nitrososphaerota archaeon]